jgi:CDP-6-deoxy-D-xylo-4-hexulose-3-dehydrase
MKWVSIGDFKFSIEERMAINEIINSNRITEGKNVFLFEKEFADFINTKYAIVTNSGTSALIMGLEAIKDIGVKSNTNIITTPLTYIATVNAIKITGYNPVFVDVSLENYVITPDNVLEHLERIDDVENYSLILPVHLMGFPVDMDEINRICDKFGLLSFEDSAQAHGTLYKTRKCGSLSIASAFSFFIAHNIQVGEMGALTTSDPIVAKTSRRVKANGRMCDCSICTRSKGTCPHGENKEYDPRFTHTHIGYNFKTTEFMAAIGLAQLRNVDKIKEKRIQNVKILNENLSKYSDILQLPRYSDDISYMAYPLLIKNAGISRSKLLYELEKKGIENRPLFYCVPTQQPSYGYLKKEYEGKLSNAEYIGNNGFYIGCHQYLKEEDIDYIINVFNEVLKKYV